MRTETVELAPGGQTRDARGRRLTPLDEREALVNAYRASGMTAAAFARREGLIYQTFAGWVQRSRRAGSRQPPPESVKTPRAQAGGVSFARVRLPAAAWGAPSGVEVVLADGTLVRGSEAAAVAEVASVLRTLPGCGARRS